MILMEIRTYFLQVKKATIHHLIKEFKINEDVLNNMLTFWINKGKLKKIADFSELNSQPRHCTQCTSCKIGCSVPIKNFSQVITTYEWIG